MSEELKPCPFCNHRPMNGSTHTWGTSRSYYVSCASCDTKGRVGSSIEEASVLWSTRPIEDALRAELARKDEEIKALNELIEAHDQCLEALGWSLHGTITPVILAKKRLENARAWLAELRGEGKPCQK